MQWKIPLFLLGLSSRVYECVRAIFVKLNYIIEFKIYHKYYVTIREITIQIASFQTNGLSQQIQFRSPNLSRIALLEK